MLTQIGKLVDVNGRLIPAGNIQVEGVPGFLPKGLDCQPAHWYGIYFEVAFENGSLWVVEQGWEQEKPEDIRVKEYTKWGINPSLDEKGIVTRISSWEEFLVLYNDKISINLLPR